MDWTRQPHCPSVLSNGHPCGSACRLTRRWIDVRRFTFRGLGNTSGMTTVLIAVDDSETSIAAARTAHHLFGDTADYVVLNVADSGPMMWGDDALQYGMVYPVSMPGVGVIGLPFAIKTPAGGSDPDAHSPIDDAARTAQNVASDAGLSDAMPIGETGDAAHAIVTAAIDHDADVIVIGSHDRSWFKRLLTPSVSGAVLRESNVPVLVAR